MLYVWSILFVWHSIRAISTLIYNQDNWFISFILCVLAAGVSLAEAIRYYKE